MNSIIKRGFRHPIRENELWKLHYSNKTNYCYNRFNRFYRKKLEKKVTANKNENSPKLNCKLDNSNDKHSNGNDQNNNNVNKKNQDNQFTDLLNKPREANAAGPLFKAFWKEFLIIALFRLFALIVQFINPLILDYLLTYINSNGPKWEGFVYGFAMFCVMLT